MPFLCVPKRQPECSPTLAEREPVRCSKFRMIPQHSRYSIVGHVARQMMHVVSTNVRRKPPQYYGEIKVRAASQSCLADGPVRSEAGGAREKDRPDRVPAEPGDDDKVGRRAALVESSFETH